MKVSRLILVTLVTLLAGQAYGTGFGIKPGENYVGNGFGEGNTISFRTDTFGFVDADFNNNTGMDFLSARFPLLLAPGFENADIICNADNLFMNCDVTHNGNQVIVTLTGVGEPNDNNNGEDDKHFGFLGPLHPGGENVDDNGVNSCGQQGDNGQDDEGQFCGIPAGFKFEIHLDSGDPNNPCGSSNGTQCGWLQDHTFTGTFFTTPQPTPEPGTMALLLTGLGALAARRRSRKR